MAQIREKEGAVSVLANTGRRPIVCNELDIAGGFLFNDMQAFHKMRNTVAEVVPLSSSTQGGSAVG